MSKSTALLYCFQTSTCSTTKPDLFCHQTRPVLLPNPTCSTTKPDLFCHQTRPVLPPNPTCSATKLDLFCQIRDLDTSNTGVVNESLANCTACKKDCLFCFHSAHSLLYSAQILPKFCRNSAGILPGIFGQTL